MIRHETGPSVVMNCAIRNDTRRSFIVAGQESHCQLYLVNMKITQENDNGISTTKIGNKEKEIQDETLRQRKVGQTKNSGIKI